MVSASSANQFWRTVFACLALTVLALRPAILLAQTRQPPPIRLDPANPVIDVPDKIETAPLGEPTFDPAAPSRSGRRRSRTPAPPAPAPPTAGAPLGPIDRTIESGGLAPVLSDGGAGLPFDLWRGLDVAKLEKLMARLGFEIVSPAMQELWRRLLVSDAEPPAGGRSREHFLAIRLAGLYRLGRLGDVAALSENSSPPGPIVRMIRTEALLARGRIKRACERPGDLITASKALPRPLKIKAFLAAAYCAASAKKISAALLVADLARDKGLDVPYHYGVLEALSNHERVRRRPPRHLGVLDYAYMRLAGRKLARKRIDRAPPPLAMAIAFDRNASWRSRIAAGERAARLGALSPVDLGELYASVPRRKLPAAAASGSGGGAKPLARAAIYQAIRRARTPERKARPIALLMAAARRAGLEFQIARLLGEPVRALGQPKEMNWFAETALAVLIVAGEQNRALGWAMAGGDAQIGATGTSGDLLHWLVPIDIARPKSDIPRGTGLIYARQLAEAGRFGPGLLHRLVTVLDALDYNIPIPLWDAANRAPRPAGGHLPETGVLSSLKIAAEKGEIGRTVLLAMLALGPKGPGGAHLIALGDAIRALKRIGFEAEARQIALEAIYPGWPRRRP